MEQNLPHPGDVHPHAGPESVMVDVVKSNFFEQSNDFIKRLPNASWIAIDEEMTGIQLPPSAAKKISKDETPAQRYPSLKKVPERYAIIQLGVCLFEESGGGFNVRRYKFTLFPPSDSNIAREIVLSPGSVRFLAEENNCNLNEWIQEGIPFCNGDVANRMLEKFREKQLEPQGDERNKPSPAYNQRRKIELTRHEDKDFHARAMASLREWLDAAIVPSHGDIEGASLLLPPCNSFLRRALYESIPAEYPNLVLETVSEAGQLRIWRVNPEERRRRNDRLQREGFEKLLCDKVGGWRVFLALARACSGTGPHSQAEHIALSNSVEQAMVPRDTCPSSRRKIPLVVHNGLHDLLFLLTHFHSPELPEDWKDCKELIHSYFPVIYDTKAMASEYCLRENSRGRTHLAAVYEQTLGNHPQWNRIFSLNGRDQLHEQLHDAGYDSYCTGAAFHGLVCTIQEQAQYPFGKENASPFALWSSDTEDKDIQWHFGRNKIYFHLSPYSIDLESPDSDPLAKGMSLQSTFRVAGIDPSVTTRDIVRCLTGLQDSSGQKVNFEIVWVDDVCFLVGAMLHSRDPTCFEEHGEILFNALSSRFQREAIQRLASRKEKDQGTSPGLWNLWGLIGGRKRSADDVDDDESRYWKRRRLE